MIDMTNGIGAREAAAKRTFDIVFALIGLALTFWLISIGWIVATLDTRANGFYFQPRVGRHGKIFNVVKLRTMLPGPDSASTVTVRGDPRVTHVGQLLRKTKLDELPQLFNVLIGNMSLVGPRPDVPGYADNLQGEDRVILELRPGITGPATLEFRDEEELLAKSNDPVRYNDEILWPRKIEINKQYYYNYSFSKDVYYIIATVFYGFYKKSNINQIG